MKERIQDRSKKKGEIERKKERKKGEERAGIFFLAKVSRSDEEVGGNLAYSKVIW